MIPTLEIRGLAAGYESDIDILKNVSISVMPGSLTGMIGLNGAGKSTLTKAIYGFLRPRRGAVHWKGEDMTGMQPHTLVKRGMWLVPQDSSLFPHLSVNDNLRLTVRRLGLNPAAAALRIEETYTRFPDLRKFSRKAAGDLSGGQRTLVECAKVKAVCPEFLIIDEPSVGLSPAVAIEVYRLIEEFHESGITIFLIDHNIRKLIELADYIYVMNMGQIVDHGPKVQFQRELKQQVQKWLGL